MAKVVAWVRSLRQTSAVKSNVYRRQFSTLVVGALLLAAIRTDAQSQYRIIVSNEKSGDITVIDSADYKVSATIPVGKRPRGVHVSPDGTKVYVALSGTPIEPPPKLDANGNPIFERDKDDDQNAKSDKAADGIGVVDLRQKKFLRKIPAGSDPEQFALSADGSRLYIANEDVGAASVLNIEEEKVEHIIPVSREPEGVGLNPNRKCFYVTCETAGDVFAIDTRSFKVVGHFQVHPRPRSAAFLPDGSRAFIPSESSGEINIVDSVEHKLLRTVALPKGSRPMCLVVGRDGKKLYASLGRGGAICVLDAATADIIGSIKVGTRPWGIAISPDGKYLFSANGPSDDVSVVDLATEKEIARVKVGSSPWGVAIAT